jgi:quinol monooxygenase YgiN
MIIVAGTVRIPENKFDAIIAVARETVASTRQEVGCIVYSFARDLSDAGLLRIYEEWESRAHLDAHGGQPHLVPWRAKLAEVGATDRKLVTYEAGGGTPL